MDVMAMKRQGLSIKEIADETGYHPKTISTGWPTADRRERRKRSEPAVIDERWAARIAELLRLAPRLLGTSVFELIRAEGYTGSYPSVTRHLHTIRGPRFTSAPAASTRIVTRSGRGVPVRLVRRVGPGRGSGDSARCSASRPSCPGHGCASGGSPPPSTASTPSRAWSASSSSSAGCPRWPAPIAWGRWASPRAGASPSTAGRCLRPVPRRRDPGLPARRRQAQGQGRATLP